MSTYSELALAFASIPSSPPSGSVDYEDIPILAREDDDDVTASPSVTGSGSASIKEVRYKPILRIWREGRGGGEEAGTHGKQRIMDPHSSRCD